MSFKITGKVTKIGDVQEGTSSKGEWKKLSFLLETESKYNNLYQFSMLGKEKVDGFLAKAGLGSTLEVEFDVSTREFKEKYYTDLSVYKFNVMSGGGGSIPKEEDLPF